ncbi:hydrogenase maturation protease [Dechloromonas sp.]|uniref:hydrogenase maturation protease n=1 Tax=Dechloromonas sp. TaxID=1917218 RepID=UPI001219E50A|nr:hydrogenase maturation protease [Dechloromonas sp.]MBU3697512.1 hydrogenase maturation protease [Dechloromonas sp.]TEX49752.1 MAG: homospermidine synthase [Rhodocyclaceae bacterium]
MTAPVAVFCIGNPSRGDDALGPFICGELEKWPEIGNGQVELIEDFQLQIEHALDLVGRQLVLFIDAATTTQAPFDFRRIFASTAVAHTSHALLPEAVLQVFCQTEGGKPPPAFVLGVRGESFELGAAVSAAAMAHAAAAMALLTRLLGRPELAAWESLTTGAIGSAAAIVDAG